MYKVFFMTFGCKVNYYETECMKSLFRENGYVLSGDYLNADVVVINSCTVTSSGDNKVMAALKKIRNKCPDIVIALTGCFPQAFHEAAAKISEADIIIGTKERSKIVSLVNDFFVFRTRIIQLSDYTNDDKFEAITCTQFDDNTRAFVKIQDGCNQFCTYCIIPYARGRCRSKPIDILKSEVEKIAEGSKKEIVLSGINLAFYGQEYGLNLADAAEICAGVKGIERIRLGSLEPEVMSESLLKRLSAIPEFCPQFHLSLQSGCNETLKSMNRKYTADEYYELTKRIRAYFPDCSFTTDIMVGFPGESEENFKESIQFVKKIGFSKVHVFRYSRRKGTVADKMICQIPEYIKSERWHRMNDISSQLQAEYMKLQVNKTVPVLFEREKCTDFHQGYAPDYTLVRIPQKNSKKSLRNMIFYVRIKESESDYCIGELAE